MLFGSAESNSMFGYSIASAGDLDQDGYQGFVFFCSFHFYPIYPIVFFLHHLFMSPKIARASQITGTSEPPATV